MLDNLNRDGDGDAGRDRSRKPQENAPIIGDREVPLSGTSTELINRWLDGESAEPTGLRGDAARHVDFWRQVGEETDRRRRMVTPAHVPAQIMAAIKQETVAARETAATSMELRWYKRTFQLSAVVALAAAAGLLALGAAISASLSVR